MLKKPAERVWLLLLKFMCWNLQKTHACGRCERLLLFWCTEVQTKVLDEENICSWSVYDFQPVNHPAPTHLIPPHPPEDEAQWRWKLYFICIDPHCLQGQWPIFTSVDVFYTSGTKFKQIVRTIVFALLHLNEPPTFLGRINMNVSLWMWRSGGLQGYSWVGLWSLAVVFSSVELLYNFYY